MNILVIILNLLYSYSNLMDIKPLFSHIDTTRIRQLNSSQYSGGPVIYWMSRDQRMEDNWAFVAAYDLAVSTDSTLKVIFNLVPEFLGATFRQYDFMLKGLRYVADSLRTLNIPFFLLIGEPAESIPGFLENYPASALVADFSPLRICRQWKREILSRITIPFYEVDAHNIVPCWIASSKQDFAARTIRPKIDRLLHHYFDEYPTLKPLPPSNFQPSPEIDWPRLPNTLTIDRNVKPISWLKPGEASAMRTLNTFIRHKLSGYGKDRNNPAIDGLSNLSIYLHFGQISAQRIALEIEKTTTFRESAQVFLEELIVRRELSDNYCFYNSNYDSWDGLPDWSKKTLSEHKSDPRQYIYSLEQFESATTHDTIWNFCQMEMVKTGKMHGYMRMYWAKKILEWSISPENAIRIAIYLNDKYELDGRDPNGYVGILWSIGGLHDRPWFEKSVYGKVRYMNVNGLRKKFDVDAYIDKIENL